jgi:hypothetical protein
MQKKNIVGLAYGVGALALTAVGMVMGDASLLLGVDAAAISDNVRGNFGAVADLLGGGAYLAGAGFGIQSALKFKAHNENPQQVKLSQPLTYGVVAGALLALPTFLDTGADTLFTTGGGDKTSIDGNSLGR